MAPDSAKFCVVGFGKGNRSKPFRLAGPYVTARWVTSTSVRGTHTARVTCGVSAKRPASLGAVETPIATSKKGRSPAFVKARSLKLSSRKIPATLGTVPRPSIDPSLIESPENVGKGSTANPYACGGCTSWAWRNRPDLPGNLGNAKTWGANAARAGFPVDNNPQVGDIIVYQPGSYGASGYGHVAVVEQVGNGRVYISEANWNGYCSGDNIISRRWSGTSGVQFIHSKGYTPGDTTPTPATPPPPPVPWTFENLEGDSNAISPHNADVGKTPTAIQFNGKFYVFHYDATYGDLRYSWTNPGWVTDILDGNGGANGRTTANVGQTPTAVVYNNVLHVLYYDAANGNLRHAYSPDGSSWTFENLDGDPGSIGGLNANLGQTPTAVVHGATLQVFYHDAQNGNLRHAWSTGNNAWSFETLDGDAGSVSHYNATVGLDPTAVSYNGTLQVFYYDKTNGNLRHSWADGAGWHFENLDGDAGSIGHLNADLGQNPTAVVYGNTVQVFYYDKTNGNLRHSWADGAGWHFETLEGDANSTTHYNGDVGAMTSATVSGGVLQVAAYEAGNGGNLRHLWSDSTGWHSENLDGKGGQPGRQNANVGLDPVITTYGGSLQLFYYDAAHGDLRHAVAQ